MFKYKINQKMTEDVKEIVNEIFQFKIILIFEFIGFSFLFSFVTESFLTHKPNFFFVFIPFLLIVTILYFITQYIKVKK